MSDSSPSNLICLRGLDSTSLKPLPFNLFCCLSFFDVVQKYRHRIPEFILIPILFFFDCLFLLAIPGSWCLTLENCFTKVLNHPSIKSRSMAFFPPSGPFYLWYAPRVKTLITVISLTLLVFFVLLELFALKHSPPVYFPCLVPPLVIGFLALRWRSQLQVKNRCTPQTFFPTFFAPPSLIHYHPPS